MSESSPEVLQDSQGHEFPCDNCGADMQWDPSTDSLSCEYCGHKQHVPRAESEIIERGLEEASDVAHGFGIEVRVAQCKGCGAKVTYDGATTSEVCVYCGEATVLAQEANRNAIRPESLIPLDIDQETVKANFKKWIRGLWFRPNALKKVSKFDAVGIYVPFWTFDCDVHSDWSADAGHHYYVPVTYTVTVNGKPQTRTRMEQRTRWVPAWGKRDDHYNDLPILASEGISNELVKELGGYSLDSLVPYRPEYLAGWRAEEYRIDLDDGWARGKQEVVDSQYSRCAGDIPGDTYRNLNVRNDISDIRWKHILLPLWSLQYRFRGKIYTVLVNGQTGEVAGKAPLSFWKIFFFFLAIVGALGVGFVAVNS